MKTPDPSLDEEERRARDGDREALARLCAQHEAALRRWVGLRIDPRLRGRISPSDVLQDVYLGAEKRLEHFRALPEMTFRVWIRLLARQGLLDAHRRHLGAGARNADREININAGESPTTGANAMAERLAADLTSPSHAAMRSEIERMIADAVASMPDLDREVLSLRHFDGLSNDEIARFLGIPKGTASKRYIRALTRLREVLATVPGLLPDPSQPS